MIDLTLARVVDAERRPELSWAQGKEFYLPSQLIRDQHLVRGSAEALTLTENQSGGTSEMSHELRMCRAFTTQKPLSSRLPIPYQIIPAPLRNMVGRFTGKRGFKRMLASRSFPLWPLDLSADFVSDLMGKPNERKTCPVVLTHDLDSPEGLINFHKLFHPIEARHKATSTVFVVPAAGPVDTELLTEVAAQGHAIGIHGYDHNNKTAYCTPEGIRSRLDASAALREQYGAKGYRAPSLVRTRPLLQGLEEAGFLYDSSIPSSGGPLPVPDTGCASARPFRIGNLWEIPLSMPRDGSLRFLDHTPQQILEIWKQTALNIAASGGVVVLLTHCEQRFSGNPEMLACYADFLEFIASTDCFSFQKIEDVIFEWGDTSIGNLKTGELS